MPLYITKTAGPSFVSPRFAGWQRAAQVFQPKVPRPPVRYAASLPGEAAPAKPRCFRLGETVFFRIISPFF
jgi:hypothetical protein